jgi:hypothetical protein
MFHVIIQAQVLLNIRLQKLTVIGILNSVICLHLSGNKVIGIMNVIRNKVGVCETPVFIVQEKVAEIKLMHVY